MNTQMKRFIVWMAGIPISLAICASVVLLLMRLEGTLFYLALLFLFLLGVAVLVISMVRSRKNEKIVNKLLDILYKDADPKAFIAASKAQIQKTRNKALKGTLSFNLAIGYEADGNFGRAISVMKETLDLTADGLTKATYYLNLASFYAQKGAVNEGLEAYQAGRRYIDKKRKYIPAAYTLFVRGLLFYAEEKDADALDSFKKINMEEFEDRHSVTKLQLYMARAYSRMGNIKEARVLYGKVRQRKTYPYLLSCANAEIENLQEK